MISDKPDAYSYENFIYGFRLGVGLMIEALKILDEFGRTVLPDISLSNGYFPYCLTAVFFGCIVILSYLWTLRPPGVSRLTEAQGKRGDDRLKF